MKARLAILAVVAVCVVGALLYSQYRPTEFKVSGYVEADEVRVGSRVGGRVITILVQEGDHVAKGDPLVELEPFDLLNLRAQTEAQLASRRADAAKMAGGLRKEEVAQALAKRDELAARLKELQNGSRKETVAAAEARAAAAEADAKYARTSLEKITKSMVSSVATQEEMDRATQALEAANAGVNQRQAELAELKAGTRAEDIDIATAQLAQAEQAYQLALRGFRQEDIDAAKAQAAAADAALRAIDDQIAELKIVAPTDGVIEALDLRAGDLLAPNAPALTMLPKQKLYVRAFVPEDRLVLQLGQAVEVTTDSFPGRAFHGKVAFVSRSAEFTPNNVQTTAKRAEQVFRVKVIMDDGLDVLRPGMPVDLQMGQGAGK